MSSPIAGSSTNLLFDGFSIGLIFVLLRTWLQYPSKPNRKAKEMDLNKRYMYKLRALGFPCIFQEGTPNVMYIPIKGYLKQTTHSKPKRNNTCSSKKPDIIWIFTKLPY
jgi:hypothetical protein